MWEYLKLKTEIWNLYVSRTWKFENWNVWILKTKNQKCMNTENWYV
jgi:hypothetical protein